MSKKDKDEGVDRTGKTDKRKKWDVSIGGGMIHISAVHTTFIMFLMNALNKCIVDIRRNEQQGQQYV